MTDDPRIQQLKRMTEADPDDQLAHFSLGRACLAAGRFDEAVAPLLRVLELNPNMSKAYQLLGEAYANAGQRDRAIEVMTRGVTVADRMGDRMPRDAMAKMLREWGVGIAPSGTTPPAGGGGGTVVNSCTDFKCSRCGRPAGRLEKTPFKGPLGEKVFRNVCSTCWREWIAMGTRVINEFGLVLSTREGQETYDQQMVEFLQFEDI
jgi:Fe-S cluster biosynthesis and repair protein YggX